MRRFITYIYEYEQGNRGRNTGFIRTDLRENSCRMELQIRGFDRFKGKCPVYLTVYENGLQAIPVTELLLTQGMGTCSFTCENNRIGNSGFDVHQAQTLTIACGNGRFLTGCLSSTPVPEALRGEFLIFQKKEAVPLPLRHRQSRSYRRNLQPNQSDSVSRKPCQNRYPSDSHKPCQNRYPSGSPKLLLNRKRSNSRKQSLNQKQSGSHKPLIRK